MALTLNAVKLSTSAVLLSEGIARPVILKVLDALESGIYQAPFANGCVPAFRCLSPPARAPVHVPPPFVPLDIPPAPTFEPVLRLADAASSLPSTPKRKNEPLPAVPSFPDLSLAMLNGETFELTAGQRASPDAKQVADMNTPSGKATRTRASTASILSFGVVTQTDRTNSRDKRSQTNAVDVEHRIVQTRFCKNAASQSDAPPSTTSSTASSQTDSPAAPSTVTSTQTVLSRTSRSSQTLRRTPLTALAQTDCELLLSHGQVTRIFKSLQSLLYGFCSAWEHHASQRGLCFLDPARNSVDEIKTFLLSFFENFYYSKRNNTDSTWYDFDPIAGT